MAARASFEDFYAATVDRLLGHLFLVTGDLHAATEIVLGAGRPERPFRRTCRYRAVKRSIAAPTASASPVASRSATGGSQASTASSSSRLPVRFRPDPGAGRDRGPLALALRPPAGFGWIYVAALRRFTRRLLGGLSRRVVTVAAGPR